MKKALLALLADFKWYRKRIGGKWFLVITPADNMLDGVVSRWTQKPTEKDKINREETY